EPLPVSDLQTLAVSYAENGWRVDDAALLALAADLREEDRAAVAVALLRIYLPWLQDNATNLQTLARQNGLPNREGPQPFNCDALLFVDGLRMDLGHRLATLIEKNGATVRISWRWTGFPTVTGTCKPLASPAAGAFTGDYPAPDF